MSDRHSIIPAVWILVSNSKGELLLLRRFNTGWRDGWYTVPAGHVEQGESPSACARRELKEEAGIDISVENLEMVHTTAYIADDKAHERVSFFFKATPAFDTAFNTEPHKADDLMWCSIDDLPENTIPLLKHVIREIGEGRFYSEFNYPDPTLKL